MGKQLVLGKDAREKILEGVNQLADAVASTLGPAGRNAIIYQKFDSPKSTRDGVTVAKSIEFDDPAMDAGAQLVKQTASQTADLAGDGTTTSTILARAIYREGIKAITEKSNPVLIKRGIDKTVAYVCEEIKKHSQPVIGDGIVAVATISANNDPKVGQLIADAIRQAGKDGVITVEESKTGLTTLEHSEGMKIPTGYISPYFITNPDRQEAILEDCYLLICEQKLGAMATVLGILEQVGKSGKQLFVIAEDVEGEVLPILVVNNLRGTLHSCAVKAPGMGSFRKELLNDIAALTGGRAILNDLGDKPENVKMEDLGRAKKIIVTKSSTTIMVDDNRKIAIQDRIKGIRTQISMLDPAQEYELDRLQDRLAKLTGGVSILKIGAASEVEMGETKGRVEDSLFAVQAAVQEGIVPGGGVTLARLAKAASGLPMSGDEASGRDIVSLAMAEPLRCIASNAGQDAEQVWLNVVADRTGLNYDPFNYGYNALTDTYEDLMEAGVIDPAKVVRTALQNAGSVAGLMLLTETLITEVPEEKGKPRLPGR